jgi:hypothetical protein
MEVANISKAGRDAIRNDSALEPNERLMLEIAATVSNVTPEHLIGLFEQVITEFGSVDRAIMAVKSGAVSFEKIEA